MLRERNQTPKPAYSVIHLYVKSGKGRTIGIEEKIEWLLGIGGGREA